MNSLATQHYLHRAHRKPAPAWLQRLRTQPAHWSGPALRFQESLEQTHRDIAEGIRRSPEPFRDTMAAMQALLFQVMRMVSQGTIRGIVKDEFWGEHCYGQVPINVEAAVKITNRLVEELGDRELRVLVNDAVAPKEKREVA